MGRAHEDGLVVHAIVARRRGYVTFWCPYERPLGEGDSFLHGVMGCPSDVGLPLRRTRAVIGDCASGALGRPRGASWARIDVCPCEGAAVPAAPWRLRRAILSARHASTGLTPPLAHYYLARQKTLPGFYGAASGF